MSSTPSLSHSPAELYRAWQDLAPSDRSYARATPPRCCRSAKASWSPAGSASMPCACGRTGPPAAGARRTGADHGADPQRALRPRTQGAVSRSDGLCQWADGPGGLAGYRPAPVSGVGTLSSPLPRRHRGVPSAASRCSTSRAWRCTRCSLPRPATSAPGNRWSSACGLPSRMPCWPARTRAPAAALVDAQIDAVALREGWAALKDTHHFHALLKKHGAQRPGAAPGWRRMGRAPGQWRPGETLRSGGRKRVADHGVRRQRPLHPDPYRACVQPEVAGRLVQRARSGIQPAPEDHRHRRALAGAQAEHRWHRNQLGGLRRRRRTDRATVRRAQAGEPERDDWRELAESFKAL